MVKLNYLNDLSFTDENSQKEFKRFNKAFALAGFTSVTSIKVQPYRDDKHYAIGKLYKEINQILKVWPLDYKTGIIDDFVLMVGGDAFEAVCFGDFLSELEQIGKIVEITVEAEFRPE